MAEHWAELELAAGIFFTLIEGRCLQTEAGTAEIPRRENGGK